MIGGAVRPMSASDMLTRRSVRASFPATALGTTSTGLRKAASGHTCARSAAGCDMPARASAHSRKPPCAAARPARPVSARRTYDRPPHTSQRGEHPVLRTQKEDAGTWIVQPCGGARQPGMVPRDLSVPPSRNQLKFMHWYERAHRMMTPLSGGIACAVCDQPRRHDRTPVVSPAGSE